MPHLVYVDSSAINATEKMCARSASRMLYRAARDTYTNNVPMWVKISGYDRLSVAQISVSLPIVYIYIYVYIRQRCVRASAENSIFFLFLFYWYALLAALCETTGFAVAALWGLQDRCVCADETRNTLEMWWRIHRHKMCTRSGGATWQRFGKANAEKNE